MSVILSSPSASQIEEAFPFFSQSFSLSPLNDLEKLHQAIKNLVESVKKTDKEKEEFLLEEIKALLKKNFFLLGERLPNSNHVLNESFYGREASSRLSYLFKRAQWRKIEEENFFIFEDPASLSLNKREYKQRPFYEMQELIKAMAQPAYGETALTYLVHLCPNDTILIHILDKLFEDLPFECSNKMMQTPNGAGEIPLTLWIQKTSDKAQEVEKILTWFLKKEININATNQQGYTAFMLAALAHKIEVMNLFINLSTSKENVTNNKRTDLFTTKNKEGWCILALFLLKWPGVKQGKDFILDETKPKNTFAQLLQWTKEHVQDSTDKYFLSEKSLERILSQALWICCDQKRNPDLIKDLISAGAKNNFFYRGRSAFLRVTQINYKEGFFILIDKFKAAIHESVDRYEDRLIHVAAIEGHPEIVKCLLENGALFEAKHSKRNSPLYYAAWKGHTEVVRVLLSFGATNENSSMRNFSPLHIAAQQGYLEIVQLLLSSENEETESQNWIRETPLYLAALNGHIEVVKHLLQNINLETLPLVWFNPLRGAASNGHIDIVELLLQKGAKLDTNNGETACTPLIAAVKSGHVKAAKFLLEQGAKIGASDEEKQTALHHAAKKDNIDLVQLLLENKAAIDLQDKNGDTPFHLVIKKNNITLVQCFLERDDLGKMRSFRDKNENTLLHLAIEIGNALLVQIILEREKILFSINAQNRDGNTPLHLAVEKNNIKIVNLLLEKKADPKLPNRSESTPLHLACGYGNIEIIRSLLKSGASFKCQDKTGKTPFHIAALEGHGGILRLFFLKHKTWMNKEDKEGKNILHIAAQNGRKEIVKFLLEKKFHIDIRDREGKTPLHLAVLGDHIDVIKFLLNRGANKNCIDEKSGYTPLHLAVLGGNPDIVVLLLKAEADLNVQDKEGQTPLHRSVDERNIGFVRILLKRKPDLNIKDNEGMTVSDRALDQCYKEQRIRQADTYAKIYKLIVKAAHKES